MNGCMIDLNKPCVSELEIIDIAVEFLLEGRPMGDCRGHLLSEFDVDADDVDRLLEKAQREVRACEAEFGSRLVF